MNCFDLGGRDWDLRVRTQAASAATSANMSTCSCPLAHCRAGEGFLETMNYLRMQRGFPA
jgi:hypothetical protein